MADPAFLTYEFSKSLPRPQLLTEIGQGLRGLQQQGQTRQLEEQYNLALNSVHQNPTNDNIAMLYQIAEPLGRFPNARAAVNDLFGRMPEPVAGAMGGMQDPNMAAYDQALAAWRADPRNTQLQGDLLAAAQRVGRADLFDEARDFISDVVTPLDEADQLKAYNAAIQKYQENPTEKNFQDAVNVAAPLGMAEQARLTMETYFSRLDAADLARIKQQQMQDFNEARRLFFSSPSPENRDRLLEAAIPVGAFDQMIEYSNTLSEEQRMENVRQINSLLTPLSLGDADTAMDQIDRLIAVASNPGEVEALRQVRSELEDGDIEGARQALYMEAMGFKEGRDYLDSLYALNQDRRADDASDMALLRTAYALEFDTEEQRNEFIETAAGLNEPLVNEVARFGRVAKRWEQTGQGRETLLEREESLRKEYDASTEGFVTMGRAAEQIRRLIETGNASGFTDNAITTIFNKVTDPSSVVRESEAARTERAQAAFDQLKMALPRVLSGEAYSEQAKQDILSAIDAVVAVADEGESMIRDRLMNTVDFMWGDNIAARDESAARIFPPVERVPIGTLTEPTVDLARDLIRRKWPNDPPQTMPDGSTKSINEMSLSEIRIAYPKTWEEYFGDEYLIPSEPGGSDEDVVEQPSLFD